MNKHHKHAVLDHDNTAELFKQYQDMSVDQKASLTNEDRLKFQHAELHEKHKGHEAMHGEMVLILFISLVIGQCVLFHWRARYNKSYTRATLLFMWTVPMYFVITHYWIRFLVVWAVFTLLNFYVVFKATRKPLANTTPRLVYKWFLIMHKVNYGMGVLGYLLVMFTLIGVNVLFGVTPDKSMDWGLTVLFYGLYFGVLSRDFSVLCTDKMATRLGYQTRSSLPGKRLDEDVCAVCGNRLLVPLGEEGVIEDTVKLPCGHKFHEFCIRGWCIVGKKETCPYCNEKVNTRDLVKHPWERVNLMYGQFLDWIRYLIAWQPLILLFVQGLNMTLGLE
ncbi:E3 ubiquitin ligase Rnf121-like [Symsagittifera roscoffensis]|uniref:E3 ubiquitin ligase Rnf121-like n=1 Tax=Symsagittifera roscoffensis TaxID=84072 RepID=UPI00307B7DEF